MSVEIRHTEKSILFSLLTADGDFAKVISQLMSTMEPEDVELVEKRVAEFEKRKKEN